MPRNNRGFTLIELIVVIILVGILSLTAASRLMGPSSFTSNVARDQAVSIARQVQQIGMSNPVDSLQEDSNHCRALTVTKERFGSAVCHVTDEQSSSVLIPSQQNVTLSSSVNLPSVVYFDLLGRPFEFIATGKRYLCSGARCQISFQSTNAEIASLCINQEGYISEC